MKRRDDRDWVRRFADQADDKAFELGGDVMVSGWFHLMALFGLALFALIVELVGAALALPIKEET